QAVGHQLHAGAWRSVIRQWHRPPTAVIDHNKVDFSQPGRWLAQWARRQQPAVAETAGTVDHGNLDVTRQRIMLQAVIAQDYIRLQRAFHKANAAGAIRIYNDRRAGIAGEQQGFIATDVRWRELSDQQGIARALATVATA